MEAHSAIIVAGSNLRSLIVLAAIGFFDQWPPKFLALQQKQWIRLPSK
jgi:hypothetical protein